MVRSSPPVSVVCGALGSPSITGKWGGENANLPSENHMGPGCPCQDWLGLPWSWARGELVQRCPQKRQGLPWVSEEGRPIDKAVIDSTACLLHTYWGHLMRSWMIASTCPELNEHTRDHNWSRWGRVDWCLRVRILSQTACKLKPGSTSFKLMTLDTRMSLSPSFLFSNRTCHTGWLWTFN